jgi:hypothetical protein
MRYLASVLIVLGLCNDLLADGLISRLPDDGTKAVFNATFNVGGEPELVGFMTIASVGKANVKDQACRWIEITMARRTGGRTVVGKVLVAEKDLKAGRDLYEKRVRGYIRQGDDRETKLMTDKNSDAMRIFLGAGKDVKKLPSVKIDHPLLGKIECTRTSKKLEFVENGNNDVSIEVTRHESAGFGVVSAKINIVHTNGDKKPQHVLITFTLEKKQENTKSLLPDSK